MYKICAMLREMCCCSFIIVSELPLLRTLASQATKRIAEGLRPRTLASYTATFKLFLAFVIYCGLPSPSHMDTIVLYLEYLAQNNLKACSLRNHIAVLKHFFALFDWPVQALTSRKVQLMVKSVQMNAQLQIKVKGVFTVKLLRKLIQQTDKYHNGCVFKALFLVAFYGFFRLASLLPPAAAMFDKTRFPVIGDLIWGNPGVHLIVTCAKNMHTSGQYQVVQLPIIQDGDLCAVIALRTMVKYLGKLSKDSPLFQIKTKSGLGLLTAPKARSFLKLMVAGIGLSPAHYTFHSFRRSGASFAFDNNVELAAIKQHGNWRSEAVWTYLQNTPTAASTIPTTFQQLLC